MDKPVIRIEGRSPAEVIEEINSFSEGQLEGLSSRDRQLIMWHHDDWRLAKKIADEFEEPDFENISFPNLIEPLRIREILIWFRKTRDRGVIEKLGISTKFREIFDEVVEVAAVDQLMQILRYRKDLELDQYQMILRKLKDRVFLEPGLGLIYSTDFDTQIKLLVEFSTVENIIGFVHRERFYPDRVQRLIESLPDQERLATIAKSHLGVGRVMAIERLEDQEVLEQLVFSANPLSLRYFALRSLHEADRLTRVVMSNLPRYFRSVAMRKIRNSGVEVGKKLREFLKSDECPDVLNNDELYAKDESEFAKEILKKSLMGDDVWYVLPAILKEISDRSDLEEILMVARLVSNEWGIMWLNKELNRRFGDV